jgi:hypothetical protein
VDKPDDGLQMKASVHFGRTSLAILLVALGSGAVRTSGVRQDDLAYRIVLDTSDASSERVGVGVLNASDAAKRLVVSDGCPIRIVLSRHDTKGKLLQPDSLSGQCVASGSLLEIGPRKSIVIWAHPHEVTPAWPPQPGTYALRAQLNSSPRAPLLELGSVTFGRDGRAHIP